MVNRKGLILFLLALFVAPFSYAGVETLFDRHGFAIYPASNAVSVQTTSNIAAVASNGARAVVPVTTAVNVSKATMALNAARLARALSPVGAAFTAYAIYDAVKSSGITTCAPPDFFVLQAWRLARCNSGFTLPRPGTPILPRLAKLGLPPATPLIPVPVGLLLIPRRYSL